VLETRIPTDDVIVMVTQPEILGTSTEIAQMLTCPGETAVTTPLPLTEAAGPEELHVTPTSAPGSAVTVADSCEKSPTVNVAGDAGETATACTVGVVTRISAEPEMVGVKAEVAVIVTCPAPTAVTLPFASTVATCESDESQTRDVSALGSALTVELSCEVAPTNIELIDGVT